MFKRIKEVDPVAVACPKTSSQPANASCGEETNTRWYVIRVKPHKEAYIQMQLASCADIDTYCPQMKTPKKYLRRYQRQTEPVFPGYVFVRLNPRTQILHLHRLHGHNSLVTFDGRPATVPEQFVAELRRKETPGGYIVFRPAKQLRVNDAVRVVHGPLRGVTGVFLRNCGREERICLLTEFMNSQRVLELPADSIEAVAV